MKKTSKKQKMSNDTDFQSSLPQDKDNQQHGLNQDHSHDHTDSPEHNHEHEHAHSHQNGGLPEITKNSASTPVERTFNESNPYYHIINQAVDPETGVGLADMGLIYQVNDHDGVIEVIMTLTSMGCPAGPMLTTDVDGVLRLQPHVKDVEIQVVWDPPWNPDMMNQEVRAMLFGGF